MTELSFLLELLLNHKLPKATQLAIKDRIDTIQVPVISGSPIHKNVVPITSTQLIDPIPNNEPIVSSPVAAQALAKRQQLMDAGGVLDKGQKSPRKF